MNLDINKMFLEKNKEIFLNNLSLEMERNLNSLISTTDNSVALEINKLYLFFKDYFNELNKKYRKDELLGILYYERKKYNDIVNSNIEAKKNSLNDYFNNLNQDIIDEDFVNSYYEKLKEESLNVNEVIDLELKKEISLNFIPKVITKFNLETDEEVERITRRINGLFMSSLISRIKEEINFRDDSLKNMTMESFKKYLELNKETVNN